MDEVLLEMLTHRIRILSVPQIRHVTGVASYDDVVQLLAALELQMLIERRSVLARPVLELVLPVIAWQPGMQMPDFGKAAYQLKSRWKVPARPTDIVQVSRRAAKRFGGYLGGRWPRTSEITHELNLAEVFLRHEKQKSEEAAVWIPEAQLYAEGRGFRERIPDAVIRRGGRDLRVVEFGGSYGKAKLQAFHAQMSSLPYEVW
jgi:hypothetical protein